MVGEFVNEQGSSLRISEDPLIAEIPTVKMSGALMPLISAPGRKL